MLSETLRKSLDEGVLAWLVHHDAEIALPAVTITEIAFGSKKIRPDECAVRPEQALIEWRRRFAGRIFEFSEDAALAYGMIMGETVRQGRLMSALHGMIAVIAKVHSGQLAARNLKTFEAAGLNLVSPWAF